MSTTIFLDCMKIGGQGIHVLLRTVECNDVKKISPELIAIMFDKFIFNPIHFMILSYNESVSI